MAVRPWVRCRRWIMFSNQLSLLPTPPLRMLVHMFHVGRPFWKAHTQCNPLVALNPGLIQKHCLSQFQRQRAVRRQRVVLHPLLLGTGVRHGLRPGQMVLDPLAASLRMTQVGARPLLLLTQWRWRRYHLLVFRNSRNPKTMGPGPW